jgi:hypothetical protein
MLIIIKTKMGEMLARGMTCKTRITSIKAEVRLEEGRRGD